MEVSKNYGHQHPLVLLNEEQLISNQSGVVADCSRCGEMVAAPCFGCTEDCGFYLHKVCADAPSELNHPLHQDHPLVLMQNSPYSSGAWGCDFCYNLGKKFVYHCSCGLDFHVKCVLFTFNIAENNLKELEHVSLQPPLIPTENDDDGEQLEYVGKCFGCREPLANSTYFSPDCGFNLHKKCAELPLKLNHMCHRKHPLLLQFNSNLLSCKICQETRRSGFVYGCSPCKFAIHIGCVSPSPIIEDKTHPHPFSLLLRQAPFVCDACGTEGSHAAYACSACNIMVHKECISLPRIIKSRWHEHRVFHTYSVHKEDFGRLDCLICHDEVNTEYGSYHCTDCNIVIHVNCATEDKDFYYIVSLEDEEVKPLDVNSITNVLERNNAGEATVIEHFKHNHYLTLSDKSREYGDKCCDGCMLPVSDSFYCCSQCEFLLHKGCAELPKMKPIWLHGCQLAALVLTSDDIFECEVCECVSNGFAYKCNECESHMCLRCATLTPDAQTYPGHEHPLLFYLKVEGKCNACGEEIELPAYCCKDCNYYVDLRCIRLPARIGHKCDDHILALTYHEVNDYSKHHYCDICEQKTDPKLWFYHCATCDTSAHVDCVLGEYPFIKIGSIYKQGDHPHPLTFVKKINYYPECIECGEHCDDLALECAEPGCNYLVHWKCIIREDPVRSFALVEDSDDSDLPGS